MSVTVGGEVAAVSAAPVIGVGMAVCGLMVGAGFLFWLGCQKTASSCEESWKKHLEEKENRRRERLRKLREADSNEVEKLRDNLVRLSQESAARAASSRRESLASIQARRAEVVKHLEQENAYETARKRLEQAREALNELQSASDEPTSMGGHFDEDQRKQFVKNLQMDIEKLERSVEKSPGINDWRPAPIRGAEIEESNASPGQPPGDDERYRRFRDLIGRFYVLIDLPSAERNQLEESIAQIQPLLDQPAAGNSVDDLTQRMNELEQQVARAESINESCAEQRRTAIERFFALQDRYTTAASDPGMSLILEALLQEVSKRIEGYRKELHGDEVDYEDLGNRLQRQIAEFEDGVHQSLLQNEQERVKSVFRQALEDLDYEIVEQETDGRFVKVVGQGRSDPMDAKVSLVFDAQGQFHLDLDHEPFENQGRCTDESFRIMTKLEELGFIVNIAQKQETWLEKVKRVLLDELMKLGYGEEAIVEEEFEEKGIRLVATRSDGESEVVTIHPKKGVSRLGTSKSPASATSPTGSQTSSTGKARHEQKIITT